MSLDALECQMSNSIWSRLKPWVAVSAAAVFFFFQFIQINMLNSLGGALYSYFNTDSSGIAMIATSYFYGNVLLLIPAGIVLDRCSTRRVLLIVVSVLILSIVGFAMAHTVMQALIARFVCGVTGAFCLLGVVRVASRWFPPSRMAFVIGLAITFAMTGGMVAQTPMSELVQHYGVFTTLMVDAGLGCFFLLFMFLFLKDYPAGQEQEVSSGEFDYKAFVLDFVSVLKNAQNWLAGLYASLINLPVFLLGGFALDQYLGQVAHLPLHDASVVSEMFFIGLIIGCPLFGWLSDKIQRRKMPMIVGSILSIIVMLLIMHYPYVSFAAQQGLFFLLGLSISSQTIAYPLVAESNSKKLTGSANSIASFLIMSGGFTITWFTRLLNSHWDHSYSGATPMYKLSDFHNAFMMMLVAFILSLIISFLLKETNCKGLQEPAE